ncbi:MAG TPA: hypothetical protein VGV34_04530, partial [Solirubrobacterales bacterium]|nr:hypothetical protein [Solirubrobacterales bacterium]
AVSSTDRTWLLSAAAALVAARLEALAVFAADFFASVVARFAWVLFLLPFLLVAIKKKHLLSSDLGAWGSARV